MSLGDLARTLHRLPVFDRVGGRLIHGSTGNYGNTLISVTSLVVDFVRSAFATDDQGAEHHH